MSVEVLAFPPADRSQGAGRPVSRESARSVPDGAPVAAVPASPLQLVGDAGAGVCVDGVCALPGD